MVWRVSGVPGRSSAIAIGSALMAPPRTIAAQTWMLGSLAVPAQARGEIQ
jgi:hypothetical protein